MITVYGIKNCDTVKKALTWLADNNIAYQLHDYRVEGITEDFLNQVEQAFGWQSLVNKRSTTWRNLDENIKNNLTKQTALDVLQQQPTLIKRPIILQDNIALIGFDASQYEQTFK